MDQIERMEELHKDYVRFCCTMENKYNGLTQLVYRDKLKKLEQKLFQRWKEGNLTSFILTLNDIRNEWMNGLTEFTQQEMKL